MDIKLFFGNKLYAIRQWDAVPRAGDYISVYGKRKGTYKVMFVVWCGDEHPQALISLNEIPEN